METIIRCAKCGKVLVEVKSGDLRSLKVVCEACAAFTRRDPKQIAQDRG
jgi:phage FluMu protein Com